jgi:hypothetical protein
LATNPILNKLNPLPAAMPVTGASTGPAAAAPRAATAPVAASTPATTPAAARPATTTPTASSVPGAPTPKQSALAAWAVDPSSLKPEDVSKFFGTMAGPMQGATTYTPSKDALVANQLNSLLAQDSPYLQSARTRALQYAGGRGLLNSSMAAGAGETAAIDSALPIASQDASSFLTSQRDNAQAQNQFARDANQFGREGALSVFKEGTALGRQRDQQTWQSGENATDRSWKSSENVLDRNFRAEDREDTQAYNTGERLSTQDWNSAERTLDRTFTREERVAVQDWKSIEAQLDRTFNREERISSQDWQSIENETGRKFTTSEREAVEDWRSGESKLDREFSKSERIDSQNFTLERDDKQFQNRLTEMTKSTDEAIRLYDKQQGTNIYGAYQGRVQGIYDDYATAAQKIQESDLDPDVKDAQLLSLQKLTGSRVEFTSTVFKESPYWGEDFSTFMVSWEDAPAGPPSPTNIPKQPAGSAGPTKPANGP